MAVVAAIGASSYLNLDQGDLEQDTAIQAKRPEQANARCGSDSEICVFLHDVRRSTPANGHCTARSPRPKSAQKRTSRLSVRRRLGRSRNSMRSPWVSTFEKRVQQLDQQK